jgi:hypothetical protein
MRHATPRNARADCCLSDMRAMVATAAIIQSAVPGDPAPWPAPDAGELSAAELLRRELQRAVAREQQVPAVSAAVSVPSSDPFPKASLPQSLPGFPEVFCVMRAPSVTALVGVLRGFAGRRKDVSA